MIESGSVVDAQEEKYGQTSLTHAGRMGYMDNVSVLLENGADLTYADNLMRGYLHGAAVNGQAEMVRLLYEEELTAVDTPDAEGLTPLHDACRHGYPEVAKVLLDLGANPKVQDSAGHTPFQLA
ncbi:ankyrin repeat protein, partial [Saccharata proteae CBS 121410]